MWRGERLTARAAAIMLTTSSTSRADACAAVNSSDVYEKRLRIKAKAEQVRAIFR